MCGANDKSLKLPLKTSSTENYEKLMIEESVNTHECQSAVKKLFVGGQLSST